MTPALPNLTSEKNSDVGCAPRTLSGAEICIRGCLSTAGAQCAPYGCVKTSYPCPVIAIRKITRVNHWLLLLLTVLTIHPALAKNAKPVAVANAPQTAQVNALLTLDGSQSTDSDGSIVKWQWTQTKGPKIKLSNAKQQAITFAVPPLKANSTSAILAFKLKITDNKKASATAKLQITALPEPVCTPPDFLQDGVCVAPPPECIPPQVLKDGDCMEQPPLMCVPPEVFLNGLCVKPQPSCKAPQILKNGRCITPDFYCELPDVQQNGQCVVASPSGIFNDTGIVACSDTVTNVEHCNIAQFPGQDAEHGRDATHYNDFDGHAGFSYTKISATGEELPINAGQWACVKDNVTGLVWEVKTQSAGLHDAALSYSNYSPAFNPKNEYATASDVTGFVSAVNTEGLCGRQNWRLPDNTELQGIVDYSVPLPGPVVEQNFFGPTRIAPFWTASAYPKDAGGAWLVYFDDGRIFDDFRNRAGGAAARLVSGDSPAQQFVVSGDGQEVTDMRTGLVWQRCVQGMGWNGTSCVGTAGAFMFQEALFEAQSAAIRSGKHWRLPNVKELASLVDISLDKPAAIDETAFPNTHGDQFWSASPYSSDAFFSWMVHFYYGSVYYSYSEDLAAVRLVRD